MRVVNIPVDDIYIPSSKRKTLEEDKALALAENILENGLTNPIYVREGKGRFVLQEGLHRLEAMRLLGSEHIPAHIVQARKH